MRPSGLRWLKSPDITRTVERYVLARSTIARCAVVKPPVPAGGGACCGCGGPPNWRNGGNHVGPDCCGAGAGAGAAARGAGASEVGGGTVPLDFGFAGGSGTDWAIAIGAAKIRLKNNVAVNAPWNPIWLVLAISLMTPSCLPLVARDGMTFLRIVIPL